MFALELDLSDVKRACAEGQTLRARWAGEAALTAAVEGQNQAIARRRYTDRTWRLTNTAYVPALMVSALGGETAMVWPMNYASYVDSGMRPVRKTSLKDSDKPKPVRATSTSSGRGAGFAGDAYLTAERILMREIEVDAKKLEEFLSR